MQHQRLEEKEDESGEREDSDNMNRTFCNPV